MFLFFSSGIQILQIYLPGDNLRIPQQPAKEEYPWYVMVGAMALPFLLVIAYLLYKYWQTRKWTRGVFPFDLEDSTANRMEAYMSITASFILLDRFRQMEKIAYLKSYFTRKYREIPVDIHDSIQRNFHYPMQLESAVSWLNRHLKEHEKKEVVQFLVSMCYLDKTFRQKEYDALKVVTLTLQLSMTFLDATVHLYRDQQHSKKTQTQQTYTNVSLKQKYANILGVSERATKEEIKKRFRELAKKYHPDRYIKDSKEQQELAHARFLQIQEAYEKLLA